MCIITVVQNEAFVGIGLIRRVGNRFMCSQIRKNQMSTFFVKFVDFCPLFQFDNHNIVFCAVVPKQHEINAFGCLRDVVLYGNLTVFGEIAVFQSVLHELKGIVPGVHFTGRSSAQSLPPKVFQKNIRHLVEGDTLPETLKVVMIDYHFLSVLF